MPLRKEGVYMYQNYPTRLNQILQALKEYPNINHTDLANLLGVSYNNLSQLIARYSTIAPEPLFQKVKDGKYTTYSLTDYGLKCCEQNEMDMISSKNNNNKAKVQQEIKKSLISYILSQSEEIDNPCVSFLQKSDISNISAIFQTEEFLFLSMTLGLIPKDFPISNIMKQEKISNNTYTEYVYGKLKQLALLEINTEKQGILQKKMNS